MYLLKQSSFPYALLSISPNLEILEELKNQYLKTSPNQDLLIQDISHFFKNGVPDSSTFFRVCDLLESFELEIQKIFLDRKTAENYIQNFYKYCESIKYVSGMKPMEKVGLDHLYKQLDYKKEIQYFKDWNSKLELYEIQKDLLNIT